MSIPQRISDFERPLWIDGAQRTRLSDSTGLIIGGENYPRQPLSADLDIYLDPSGDDSTGDGSSGSPWKTPQRAQEAYQNILPGDFNININVAKGVYTSLSRFSMNYPFGANLRWQGAMDTLGPYNFSNFSTTQTDANFADLEYIDFDIAFTGGDDFQVGYFVRIEDPSGGTNPEATIGLHRVEAVDGGTNTATVRVWRRVNTAEVPSGSISGTVELIKSVFQFPGAGGIFVEGPISSGQWGQIVLEGDKTSYDNNHGVETRSGGVFLADGQTYGPVGVHSFRRGIVGSTGGTLEVKQGSTSKLKRHGVVGFAGSVVVASFFTTINGSGQGGVDAVNSNIDVTRLKAQACTRQICVGGNVNSLIDARLSELYYDSDGANIGIQANNMSSIDAESGSITGFSTNTSPAADTEGNDHSYVST